MAQALRTLTAWRRHERDEIARKIALLAINMAAAGDLIVVTDNGGGDGFCAVNARGRLVCHDGSDWWALLPAGLWCVGREHANFVVLRQPGSTAMQALLARSPSHA